MPAQIALVAKVPIAGIVKTRLTTILAAREAADLYEAMLADTLRAVAQLGLPVTVCYAPAEGRSRIEALADEVARTLPVQGPPHFRFLAQVEGDLGTRLIAIATELLPAGPVIYLGADSPHAEPGELARAVSLLETNDVVLGPADDGGYWLIGIAREQPQLFTSMPWSTPEVLAKTRSRAARLQLTVAEVARQFDIDDEDSLHRLAIRLAGDRALARRIPRTYAALVTLGMIAED